MKRQVLLPLVSILVIVGGLFGWSQGAGNSVLLGLDLKGGAEVAQVATVGGSVIAHVAMSGTVVPPPPPPLPLSTSSFIRAVFTSNVA